MYKDILNLELNKNEKMFPGKSILNKTQMLKRLGKSNTWFRTRIEENRLDELPKFTSKVVKRKGKPYNTYDVKTYDIALFLASE